MMNSQQYSCFQIIQDGAESFRNILSKNSGKVVIPEFPWRNDVYASVKFRRGHVEHFQNNSIAVLHVTVFPHTNDPSPIYGFDVVSGASKPAGCYIDISPSLDKWDGWTNLVDTSFIEKRKQLPNWAGCFSEEFLAFAPENEYNLKLAIDLGLNLLQIYLKTLSNVKIPMELDTVPIPGVIEAQNRYCDLQRSNDKTYNVLAKMIGEDQARYFIDKILFPKITDTI